MANYDIVIRNGQVADGTGKKLFAADVALKGDRIAAVEAPGALKGDNEIDAKGKVVAPGFIDVHTHDDTALIDNPDHAMKGEPGRDHGGVRQLRRVGRTLHPRRCRPFPVADRAQQGNISKELRGVRGQGRRRQARHQRRLPDRPFDRCA
jgi:hypothetical protein